MLRQGTILFLLGAIAAPLLIGFLIAQSVFDEGAPNVPTAAGFQQPTPTPTNVPDTTPTLPPGPLPPTPPPPKHTNWLEATRQVIANLDTSRKRGLTQEVVAIKTYGLPERPTLEIVLFHLPTGSQIIVDRNGNELHRFITDDGAQTKLEGVKNDATLMQEALSLAR